MCVFVRVCVCVKMCVCFPMCYISIPGRRGKQTSSNFLFLALTQCHLIVTLFMIIRLLGCESVYVNMCNLNNSSVKLKKRDI